jgi:hypothetical protein
MEYSVYFLYISLLLPFDALEGTSTLYAFSVYVMRLGGSL